MATALALVLVAIITTVPAVMQQRRLNQIDKTTKDTNSDVKAVKLGVDTFNETSLGQNSANRLTDEIEAKPYEERTAQEQRHLDAAAPRDPPQGPPR